jgi:phospholipid transport system transporter-binding protein
MQKILNNLNTRLRREPDQVQVSGELCFSSVLKIRDAGLNYINQVSEPVFNCNKVTNADSAGVALLVEWWRHATLAQKTISFIHVPNRMIGLIKVGNLEDILEVHA